MDFVSHGRPVVYIFGIRLECLTQTPCCRLHPRRRLRGTIFGGKQPLVSKREENRTCRDQATDHCPDDSIEPVLEPPFLVGDAQLTQDCADHGGTVQVAFQPRAKWTSPAPTARATGRRRSDAAPRAASPIGRCSHKVGRQPRTPML